MEGNPNSTGSFLAGFSNGFSNERDRKAMAARQATDDAARKDDRALEWAQLHRGGQSGQGGVGAYGGSSRQDGDAAPMMASDPANTALAPYQRAFLNAIASGESAGKYNVRYTPQGGSTFDLSGGHPRIYENGPAGKSSAAGRYQFTWSTWKDTAGADTAFTPENQDQYAWQLATKDYHRNSGGRDLATDLQANGMTPDIQHALHSTWTSLGSSSKAASTYADSLSRYNQPPQQQPVQQPTSRSLSFAAPGTAQKAIPQGEYLLGKPAQ